MSERYALSESNPHSIAALSKRNSIASCVTHSNAAPFVNIGNSKGGPSATRGASFKALRPLGDKLGL